MTVTDQQARAIAFLAAAVRPSGARKWDEAGVVANVLKVRDRSLASVVIATMQAADDRGAENPGVIPTNGPHWSAPSAAAVTTQPAEHLDPVDRCSVCSLHRDHCNRRWSDHDFQPSHRKPSVEGTAERVKSMKAEAACHIRPPDPEKVPVPVDLNVQRLREAMTRPTPEPEPTNPNPAPAVEALAACEPTATEET